MIGLPFYKPWILKAAGASVPCHRLILFELAAAWKLRLNKPASLDDCAEPIVKVSKTLEASILLHFFSVRFIHYEHYSVVGFCRLATSSQSASIIHCSGYLQHPK